MRVPVCLGNRGAPWAPREASHAVVTRRPNRRSFSNFVIMDFWSYGWNGKGGGVSVAWRSRRGRCDLMAPCRRGEGRSPRQVAGGDTLHCPPHAARALYTHTFALTHALSRSLCAACRFGDCATTPAAGRGPRCSRWRACDRQKGTAWSAQIPLPLRSLSFLISSSSIASSGCKANSFAGVLGPASSSSCRNPSLPWIIPILPPDLDWPCPLRLDPRLPSRTRFRLPGSPFYGGLCGCESKISGDARPKFAIVRGRLRNWLFVSIFHK